MSLFLHPLPLDSSLAGSPGGGEVEGGYEPCPSFLRFRRHRKAPGDLSLGYDAPSAKVPSPPLCLGDCPLEPLSASSSSSDLPRPRCLRQAGGLQGSTHTQTNHYIITWQVTVEKKKKTERWGLEKKVGIKKDGTGAHEQFRLQNDTLP